MESLKEYLKNKENLEQDNEILDEGIISFILKVLGFGAAGLASAWVISLIAKGAGSTYRSSANNIKTAYTSVTGKEFDGSVFRRNLSKEKEKSGVKDAEKSSAENKKKFSDILGPVYSAIDDDNSTVVDTEYTKKASLAYSRLSNAQKAMPEINQSVIEACTKKYGLPVYGHTPGSISYQKIKAITGNIRIAKAASLAVEEKLKDLGESSGQ